MNRDMARTVQTFTMWGQLAKALKALKGLINFTSLTCGLSSSKGCDILDGKGKYTNTDKTKLEINKVDIEDNASFTCTLTFTLGGITGSVSETIDAWVRGKKGLDCATWYFTLLVQTQHYDYSYS